MTVVQVPRRATIVSFVRADGTGVLELENGEKVPFGASACVGFEPAVGSSCWLVETMTTGNVLRARTVNLTGIPEPDRLTQAEDAWRARVDATHQAELAEKARRRALGARPYESVRDRTGFEIPALYRRMQSDGVLSYAGPQGPVLGSHGNLEWWSLEDVAAWEPPDDWIDTVVLVPFGAGPSGDLWCWCPSRAPNDEAPIVIAAHDVNEVEVVAREFEAWLVVATLELCAGAHDLEQDQAHDVLQAEVERLRPYVRDAWFTLLTDVAGRPAALEPSELEEIVRREALLGSVGGVFPHTKP